MGAHHHGQPQTAQQEAGAQMRRITRISFGLALGLSAAKLVVWQLSGAVSLLASATDSLLDALASGLTAWAVGASLEPPDQEHPYGHGKLEPLAGLAQSLLIGVSAAGLLWQAWERWQHPEPMQDTALGLGVMVVASLATLFLVREQRKVAAQTGSTAIAGDSMHYASDLLMNAAVMVALGASTWLGWTWADPLLGGLVAVIVARSAWQIGNEAVHLLMDREASAETRDMLLGLAMAEPGVLGVHKLRTRKSGLALFVEVHIELDGALPLREAHDLGQRVSARIRAAHPGAEVLVHLDPN